MSKKNKYKPNLTLGRWQNNIPDRADLVITDPPYGITGYDWDDPPDLENLMISMLALTGGKPVIVFGCQPFTSAVVQAAPRAFKYEIIWEKHKATGHLQAKHRPMRAHENILVFYTKKIYNPQMQKGTPFRGTPRGSSANEGIYGQYGGARSDNKGTRYPRSVMKVQARHRDRIHGTQKPLLLLQHLIKTYSNEGDLVFDPFGGSGSTGVAAMLCNRRSIITESDPKNYAKSAAWLERIEKGEDPGK